MRLTIRLVFVTSMVVLSFIAASDAWAAYTFANIADTTMTGPYGGTFEGFGTPAISGNTVAFNAGFVDGTPGGGLFLSSPIGLVTIAKDGDPISPGVPGGISGNTLAFQGAYGEPGFEKYGIFTGSGGPITIIATADSPPPPGLSFERFGPFPAIDDNKVAFEASAFSGTQRGILLGESGSPLITIMKVGDPAPSGTFMSGLLGEPVISGNTVAFFSRYTGGQGVFSGSGGPLTTIAKTGDPAPSGTFTAIGRSVAKSGNNVLFIGSYSGGNGIFTGSGGTLTTVVKTGDPAPSGTFTFVGGTPSIGGSIVAFEGGYTGSQSGLFTADGGAINTVIKRGDPLFGSTLVDFEFSNYGLDPDGSGQLAFWYNLSDRRFGIALATPELSGPGSSQGNPLLPTNPGGAPFLFDDVTSGLWFDPPFVDAYNYTAQPGTLFSQILDFPTGFADQFTVAVQGSALGQFGPGQTVSFAAFPGGGVSGFTVSGINPLVDSEDPRGFPLRIAFTTPTGSFSMTAVPEPSTMLLLGLAAMQTLALRRWFRA